MNPRSPLLKKVAEQAGAKSVATRGTSAPRKTDRGRDEIRRCFLDALNAAIRERGSAKLSEKDVPGIVSTILEGPFCNHPVSEKTLKALPSIAVAELFGYGPIDPLMKDGRITDILVSSWDNVFVEMDGKHQRSDATFLDEAHLKRIIDRIVSAVGRRVDDSSPMVDARMPDGSRVNVILPPLAVNGASMSIRKFTNKDMTLDDMVQSQSLSRDMSSFLEKCVRAKLNILVSGGTGSGKTTLLNVLSSFIDENDRIVTIEDAAELTLRQADVVPLETRPPNMEGKGAVTQGDLVKNALRMRPDRIIVGEARGAEALDLLQAMNTGHDGSMSTIHANKPKDALARLEVLVGMGDNKMQAEHIKKYIASAVDIVVQVARLQDGKRKITSITEVCGMEGDEIVTQELFFFNRVPKKRGGATTPGFFGRSKVKPFVEDRFEEFEI